MTNIAEEYLTERMYENLLYGRGRLYVYRCYDKDGVLLFISHTDYLKSAQEGHKQTAAWYDRVAWVEVEKYEDVKLAKAAKIAQIKKFKPLFNRAYLKPQRPRDGLWPIRSYTEKE